MAYHEVIPSNLMKHPLNERRESEKQLFDEWIPNYSIKENWSQDFNNPKANSFNESLENAKYISHPLQQPQSNVQKVSDLQAP